MEDGRAAGGVARLTFEIEINGRNRRVSVERSGTAGQFRVTVDGQSTIVDARRTGDDGLSLLFPESSNGGSTVLFAPGPVAGELLAYLSGRTVPVTVNGRRTGHGHGDAGGAAHGEQKISAPMPGRVVRVLVAPGDEVQSRQPVVVVEAMKMENELRSPKAGRVKDVSVAAGTSVEAGRVLVVVE
jgi:acetyl/propionyl-CoA carboxylase alpha subunit